MTKKEFVIKIIQEAINKEIEHINKHGIRLYYKEIDGLQLAFTAKQFDFIKPFCAYDGTSYKNGERKYKLNFKVDGFDIKFAYSPITKYFWQARAEHETYSMKKWLAYSEKIDNDDEFYKLVADKKIKTLEGIDLTLKD